MSKREDAWRWPVEPRQTDSQGRALIDRMKNLRSPYMEEKPPICYPGTTLQVARLGRAKHLLGLQLNNIGTHTHRRDVGDEQAEGGFDATQLMEAEAVWMLASVMGGGKETVDGYFCGGATEANMMGVWIGREYLRSHPDPMNRGIAVLCTPLTHYSVHKACGVTDIGQSGVRVCERCSHEHLLVRDPRGSGVAYVGMNERGEMDPAALERTFRLLYADGFRRFLIVGNIGTTVLGSIDPIGEIGTFIEKQERDTLARFYLHVDAAFGGFTVPFVNPGLAFGFNVPRVMSVAVDGDKMGQLPYPGGVFLCRRGLQSFAARTVPYVLGHQDDTLSGSRTSLAPALAWFQFQETGILGQRAYVESCLKARNRLAELIAAELPTGIYRLLPASPWINILPVVMAMDDGRIPDAFTKADKRGVPEVLWPLIGLLEAYHLRSDFVPKDMGDPDSCPLVVYKICVMPHLFGETANGGLDDAKLRRFVADLKTADQAWNRWKAGA